MRFITPLLCLLFCCISSIAQEQLIPLKYNSVLANSNFSLMKTAAADTIDLPFFEDFADLEPYPSAERWETFDVYVNGDLGIEPISIGVATFDGLDETGQARSFGGANIISDELRSVPIDLDYPASDSIYFSFYFQAKGLGDIPESSDSLYLEFKSLSFPWTRIWAVGGGVAMTDFQQVMIPIADTNFLEKGFQFRFLNYGSPAGSMDHWHVDYIELDQGRSISDTIEDDIAMTYRLAPLFENKLRSIPWSHFKSNQVDFIQDSIVYTFRNSSNLVKNVGSRYRISDQAGFTFTSTFLNDNILPSQLLVRHFAPDFNFIPLNTLNRNDILFEVYLDDPSIDSRNDTLKQEIVMNDYYAYDDGTAEVAYALLGANSELAVKFEIPDGITDTLAGVLVHFAQAVENTSNRNFKIGLYEGDNNGPSNLIYQMDTFLNPSFKNYYNGFTYIPFDTELLLNGGSSGKTYFISMFKSTAATINIGFDLNSDANEHLFYRFSSNWSGSLIDGALMFRPVMGAHDRVLITEEQEKIMQIEVYPNPSKDLIHITCEEDIQQVNLINMQGQTLLKSESLSLDISSLSPGMYLVQVISKSGKLIGLQKVVKQ